MKETKHHYMNLHPIPFSLIKNKIKNVEMRLYDERRKNIKPKDMIFFTSLETYGIIKAIVKNIRVFKNFKELYKNYNKIQIGYKEDEVPNPDDMLQYYTKEDIERYGVCAIEIDVID